MAEDFAFYIIDTHKFKGHNYLIYNSISHWLDFQTSLLLSCNLQAINTTEKETF